MGNLTHIHRFNSEPITYQDGRRYVVKRWCRCGAIQREIEEDDRYGPLQKRVFVNEKDGSVWESHVHLHVKDSA